MRSKISEKGSAMIVALIFAAIISIALGTYLRLALHSVKIANRSFYLNEAQDLTDSGLEHALWSLNNEVTYTSPSNWTTGGFTARSGFANQYQGTFPSSGTYYSLSGGVKGQVKVWVDNSGAVPHAVSKSIVTLGDGSTLIKMVETFCQQRSFSNGGMVARNGIDFNGNVMIDSWISYDDDGSTLNDVPYSNAVRRTEAHIASPSLITVQNADVFGYASIGTDDNTGISVGATGKLAGSFGAGNGIDSSRITYDFTASFPDVTPVPTGGSSLGTINSTTTLTTGTYQAAAINLSGGGKTLEIGTGGATPTIATVTLVVSGNVGLSGNVAIIINPGSKLTLYVGGDMTATGAAAIQNGGSTVATMDMPSSFTLLGTRTAAQIAGGMSMQTWDIKGTSYLSCATFAPNANISVNGTGDTFGSVVGNAVHMVGSGNFHQDESLSNVRTTGLWELTKWRELTLAADRGTYSTELGF
ncbi:MAG: hypothetical protein ABIV50_02615 [Opitutus sp.]